MSAKLNALDPKLSALVGGLDSTEPSPDAALHNLLAISAELESLAVQFSFRFGATAAYEAIVHQRIEVLREERVGGRQTFGEFMMRRYDPAMRTVKSAEKRLAQMAERAQRAAELLRTRVDIELERQNQELLGQMNRRAKLQLHLQEAVEGLSVVVLTYYGSQLVQYIAKGTKELHHLNTDVITAVSIPVIAGLVAWGTRRMRKKLAAEDVGH